MANMTCSDLNKWAASDRNKIKGKKDDFKSDLN